MHKSLRETYLSYKEKPIFDHWLEYAEFYERHFPEPGGPLKLLEIGVQSGGSSRVWRSYYGKELYYVGLDINPESKRSEVAKENTFVEIGSQMDAAFLRKVCEKHGPFDLVVDDGAHTAEAIRASLLALWPGVLANDDGRSAEYDLEDSCLKPRAVYAVEDLHIGRICETRNPPDCPPEDSSAQGYYGIVTELFHRMHAHWGPHSIELNPKDAKEAAKKTLPGQHITGIHLYDSLMFIMRGQAHSLTRISLGKDFIPY